MELAPGLRYIGEPAAYVIWPLSIVTRFDSTGKTPETVDAAVVTSSSSFIFTRSVLFEVGVWVDTSYTTKRYTSPPGLTVIGSLKLIWAVVEDSPKLPAPTSSSPLPRRYGSLFTMSRYRRIDER